MSYTHDELPSLMLIKVCIINWQNVALTSFSFSFFKTFCRYFRYSLPYTTDHISNGPVNRLTLTWCRAAKAQTHAHADKWCTYFERTGATGGTRQGMKFIFPVVAFRSINIAAHFISRRREFYAATKYKTTRRLFNKQWDVKNCFCDKMSLRFASQFSHRPIFNGLLVESIANTLGVISPSVTATPLSLISFAVSPVQSINPDSDSTLDSRLSVITNLWDFFD